MDIRDRDFKAAKRWSDETVFANRAYFLFEKQPGELAVQNAKDTDTGIYRCRVDFKVAQTRNSKVNLTVIREYNFYLSLLLRALYAHSRSQNQKSKIQQQNFLTHVKETHTKSFQLTQLDLSFR